MSSALDALTADELFAELERDHPRGIFFARTNATVVRQVVAILQERLGELGLRLRLRLEPPLPFGEPFRDQPPPPPTRLSIKDESFAHRVEISIHEQAVIIGDERIVVTARDGAVKRIGAAVIAAVKRALNV
ncbi:MAG TPA: hypothetical protein VHU18_00510 [Rhizomicrobium sp.]|jgi:hypothetical protein|nr:hypothetical protein [Rhizomicrobium sp.]